MSVIALPKGTPNGLRDLGYLQDIPAVRQLGLIALVAATIAVGLWLFFWTQKPDYVPVQAGLDAKSSNEASELLRGAQIPFRIDPASGALAVPTDQVAAARMALAEAGLQGDKGVGFESMQGDQGFGTSQFIENARYQQALQTELARTISTLRPVREARVHLALPKPSAFTRQNEPASASVVLELRSGSTLEQGQVQAIVHLVASSIPDLAPERVTVVDQFGRMLSSDEASAEDAQGARQFEQQRRQEAVYVQRIQELLEPMTGHGRVSAQVSVDMDFNQTEEASERYAPQSAMVRSEQVSESGTFGAAGAAATGPAQGVPGSASNSPTAANTTAPAAATGAAAAPAPAAGTPAGASSVSGPGSRTAVRNYEMDRVLTHTRQAPGRIRRVTAAVLVDNVPQAAGETGKKPAARPLNEAELKRIETLVQQAIGFDGQRGDVVSVVNAPFARENADPAADSPPIWEHPRARDLLRTILGGLAVLVLIFTVLRPAFRALLSPRKRVQTAVELVERDEEIQVSLSPQQSPRAVAQQQAAMNFDEKLEVARTAVNTDAKRVAQVVRGWVEADG
ncbi:flagellar basal-body MS-ring/collar protein FliF [Agrilutibacter solisilvae]|uniref:Flagellar M-ring protein n=1 Tax=Agrilutibacter solisilvae TaxID=2763317 RepID=A0A974XZB8_9GAMM|nr:flagellar basal-body MS-ring/collar protein FliF [Lysobacter solisilvae]QSX77610.1 flagellar M-ring protein FliF [Lysobacter solisilvae]